MVQVSAAPTIASIPSQIRQIAKAKFWHDRGDKLIKSKPDDVDFCGQLGNYRTTRILATGGMSVLFEVQDIDSKKIYVAKIGRIFENELIKYLYQEGRVLAHLEDKRIVGLVDFGVDKKYGPFVIMEKINGTSLLGAVQKAKIKIDRAIEIGAEICKGVKTAHDIGLIVRDISANNTIITENEPVLIDFGVARFNDGHLNSLPECDNEGAAIVGNYEYMAPEVAQGENATIASDIYAIGVILHFMITRIRPFHDLTPFEDRIKFAHSRVLAKIFGEPTDIRKIYPSVPEELAQIIMATLEKNPENRIKGTEELISALEAV